MKAARSASDDSRQPLGAAATAASQVAARMRSQVTNSLHLVVALLSDRGTAAYRALNQLGVDISRLRLAAMNLGLTHQGPTQLLAPSSPRSACEANRAQSTAGRARPRSRAQLVSPEEYRDHRRRVRDGRTPASSAPASPAPAGPGASESKDSKGVRLVAAAPPPHATVAAEPRGLALPKKRFPLLNRLGRNLTAEALAGRLEPAVCRDREVQQVLDVLAKRLSNNPCVVGPAGVGKTRIVQAVAQHVAAHALRAAASVDRYVVIEISAGGLIAGTGVRGGLAARMQALCAEIAASPHPVVIFFDEIHQLFTGDGGEELASEFKLAVSRGQLPCIGTTTAEEYARCIEKDPALHRRFTLVEVEEPSRKDALTILRSLAARFESHHGVRYRPEALERAIEWSVQYLTGRALPDKAVSIIDLSGARARRRARATVGIDQVAAVVSEMAEVPVDRLLQTDGERMLQLESTLAARVVGHQPCLAAVARSIRRNAAGLGTRRPIGTFLLLGPTGVGKTETAKALAEALFFSEHAMTRIDLSEYSEPHAVARLLGAPPGYVGHESGGQLTEAVRRRPYQVLLLDELEKAHDDVLESFLAVFDEGRMTDGRGRSIDFTNTVIVMTSNLGAKDLAASRQVGFQHGAPGGSSAGGYAERLIARARKSLAPELYNRIDEVLVFEPLLPEQIRTIAVRQLQGLSARLQRDRGITLEAAPSALQCLLECGGVDLALGARPMRRTIARLIENPLAEMILRGQVRAGSRVVARARGRRISLDVGLFEPTAAE